MLTKRQTEILKFITAYLSEHNYSPSYQEIADRFGLASKATVHQHLHALCEKGALELEAGDARSIRLAEKKFGLSQSIELPLAGLITAGLPIEAIEEKETMAVPVELVSDPANSYVLRVKGESMIEDGILDGDYVIIQRNPSPRNGDVVVALLNNEYATLKKFYREKNRIRLQPANSGMKPFYAKDPSIQGIVRAIIRKFQTA